MLSGVLLLLIIALAVAVGCYVGQRHLLDLDEIKPRFSRDYFLGLNYLLNEQPDKAVDVFTRLLHVDPDTVETHLALGSLFRRRGEVGRAIKIHQNIMARPQLPKQYRAAALIALGKDYLHAGLIDRAERLFLEIVSTGEQPTISLPYLLEIYQQQKNWSAAIKVAQQLNAMTDDPLSIAIAHFYCETAQLHWQNEAWDEVEKALKAALKADENCVRASLMEGKLSLQKNQPKIAIQQLEKIIAQDKTFFVEALPDLISAYRAIEQEEKLIDLLRQQLADVNHINIVLYLTACEREKENDAAAIQFLSTHLKQRPSLRGLQHLISLQLEHEAVPKSDLLILQEIIRHLLKQQSFYRCLHCGFKSNLLLWLCPGCKSWSSIKPVN